MQAHARVCEENKRELEKQNDVYRNDFMVRSTSLQDHMGRMGKHIEMIFLRMI